MIASPNQPTSRFDVRSRAGSSVVRPWCVTVWIVPNDHTKQWFDVFLETMPGSLAALEVDPIEQRRPRSRRRR